MEGCSAATRAGEAIRQFFRGSSQRILVCRPQILFPSSRCRGHGDGHLVSLQT
jgi:hypothetical protein